MKKSYKALESSCSCLLSSILELITPTRLYFSNQKNKLMINMFRLVKIKILIKIIIFKKNKNRKIEKQKILKL